MAAFFILRCIKRPHRRIVLFKGRCIWTNVWQELNHWAVWPFSTKRFYRSCRLPNDKSPFVVTFLIGWKNKETPHMWCIPMDDAVHYLTVGKSNLDLPSCGVIKALHGEVIQGTSYIPPVKVKMKR
jgi:hypothetical protein